MAVAAYTGNFTKINTVTTQDIALPIDLTGAAAGSWAIQFWTAGSMGATGVWSTGASNNQIQCIGYTTGAANSYCFSTASANAGAGGQTYRRFAAKAITTTNVVGTGFDECDFVGFNTGTGTTCNMRLNWTAQGLGVGNIIMYVVYTGLTNAKVVTNSFSTTGSLATTGAGFKPDLVLMAGSYAAAGPDSGTYSYLGFGMFNKHGQQAANGTFAKNNPSAGNTSTYRFQQTDACLAIPDDSGALLVEAKFESMDTDGFHLYASTAGGVNRRFIALCMGGVSSKIGSFATVTGSNVVPTRHGFTPRGLLLSGFGGSSTSGSTPVATWELGFTDGTNSRVCSYSDDSAAATSNVKSLWRNDAICTHGYNASTFDAATFTSYSTSSFTVNFSTFTASIEYLYLLIGDAGTNTFPTMMPTASTITNAAATGTSNQKHAVTLSTGRMVMAVSDTGTNAKFLYSDDGLTANAVDYGSPILGWSIGSISPSWVDSGGVERIAVIWKQSGTGGGRTNADVYVSVGTFNGARTTLTWTTTAVLAGGGWTNYTYPDITAAAESTGGAAHVVISGSSGTSSVVYYVKIVVDVAGAISSQTAAQVGGDYLSSSHTYPSVDIDTSTKRLHAAWSAGTTGTGKGVRYRTASYSAGAWTWATEVEVDNTRYILSSSFFAIARWNSHDSMLVVGAWVYNGTTYDLMQYESTNFTTFPTTRSLATGLAGSGTVSGQNFQGSFTIDSSTGDSYFVGGNGAGNLIGYTKWTRATTTLSSTVWTDASNASGNGTPIFAWYSGSTARWIYTRGNNSPYALTYDQLSLNTAPTIAFGASSLADASFPNTATPTLTVYVTDPDSSQTLTVTYEVASDAGFSSIVYTGTATAASPQTAGAVSKTTTALTKGALRYWRARVSDGSATSANTATRTFTIYDDPTVAIGASTPATTTSTGGPTLNVGWTYGQGQSLAEAFYRVQVQTNGGATTYYDSGTLAGPATSVALDAVALAIPTDTTGTALQVVVTVTAATTGTVVTATKTFDIQWGVVTVGIVSPTNGAIVATTGITAQWTFASTRSKLQGSYRIRLMIASTGSVLLDTGFVTSAATSAAVGVILVDGSTYSLEVTLKNDQGILGT